MEEDGKHPPEGKRQIDRLLHPGEQILYRTRLHWMLLIAVPINIILGAAIFWLYTYIAALPASMAEPSAPADQMVMDLYPQGVILFYLIGVLFMLSAMQLLIRYLFSELAITDQRVVGRYGALWSKPVNISLADVARVTPRRYPIFNQGTVILTCVPHRFTTFQNVPRPKEFCQWIDRRLPTERPQVGRIRIWGRLLTFFITLLIVAAGVFTLSYFSGGREWMKPAEMVTFESISQFSNNRQVIIEGTLDLPRRVSCDTDCGVSLVDYTDPELSIPIFIDVPTSGEPLEPNQMDRLPVQYDYEDFRVRLNDGSIVGDGAAVRLTGRICHTVQLNHQCISEITRIEEGHPPAP